MNSIVSEVRGERMLDSLTVTNTKTGEQQFFKQMVSKITKAWPLERQPLLLETIIPGIFDAGDVRYGSVKRIAAGVGEGSTAIQLIHDYLSKGDVY